MKRKIYEHPSEVVEETTIRTLKFVKKYHWKYRNIIFLFISFVIAYYILTSDPIVTFIQNLGNLGYPASFVGGMFFTYGMTTAPATVTLYTLGKNLNPLLIAFVGAFGSVISDYIIFKFVQTRLLKEIKLLSGDIQKLTKPISDIFRPEERLIINVWNTVSKSRIWQFLIPAFAGFIIASPLPDELGVALFGAVKFPVKKFVIFAYLFNFVGIFLIAYSPRVLTIG